ncbi:MbnP family copper-binding protein [Parathalassolituus penaei]|uniref:Metallo-mystery pair system four-Cys motif protein n=1 Tax=Parathalassolituus penaei TaxID=2997323 RepID=A0A9X3EIH5_9GAMM|nr:MbnP family copper-binding protein [Parathalassolituus penaei]MCY0967330.1 metallo-mystery pair system four-Cys motif protein [Parathalassolituus penaei]
MTLKHRRIGLAAAIVTSSLLLTACGGDSSTNEKTVETRELTLDFRAINSTVSPSVDVTDSICDTTLAAVGTEGTDAAIAYMAFYVSNVRLITSSGAEVAVTLDEDQDSQEQGIALVDFRDITSACGGTGEAKAIWNDVTGTYEHTSGTSYTGLKYQLGLPASINHAAPETAGVLSSAVSMSWGWLSGYRYLRMDLMPAGGVQLASGSTGSLWTVHLGATGCSNAADNDGTENRSAAPSGGECDTPNLSDVSLSDFNPDSSKIAVDIAALYAGSNLTVDTGGPSGCMSGTTDAECAEIFARLGLQHATQGDAFTTPIQQVVFSTLND